MRYRDKYGHRFPESYSDAAIELYCFSHWVDESIGGLGRYQHFSNAVKMIYPDFVWDDWFEMRVRAFCDPENWVIKEQQRFLCLANVGCKSAGKTHGLSLIGFIWWLSMPQYSTLAITSIQKAMVRARSWAAIQKYYYALPERNGMHIVDSMMKIQSMDPRTGRKSDKHSIIGLAVGQGETDKARQKLAGMHPEKRYMLIVDEAAGTPEAIFAAVPNMRGGCQEFVLIVASNGESRMDPHGRICEPIDGWNSVNLETGTWRTKGVKEWQIDSGVCQHFPGHRSPNVKRSKTIIPYLYTYENYLDSKGKEDTLAYWVYDAGFWAPEGITNTVFDEATIQRVDGMGTFTWKSWRKGVGACDPAFGGDDCTLRFGEYGDIEDGRIGMQLREKVPIKLKQNDKTPLDYQIARQIINECQKRGVSPEDFGIDATGIGQGVASILAEEWSPLIKRISFAGSPSDVPVSQDDPRPCKEAYDRKVTELWYQCREILVAGQLRGLDRETVSQFCKRTFELKGRKISLEKKEDCKLRMGRSPDDADCVAVMAEVLRQRGLTVKRKYATTAATHYEGVAKRANAIYDDGDDRGPRINSDQELNAWLTE